VRGIFGALGGFAMNTTFDEGYARYLSFLAKLDDTNDIKEKNVLFRQLTEQLSELESKLSNKNSVSDWDDPVDDSDLTYWI
jgi:hypothetical protein